MSDKELTCSILTPEGAIYNGPAKSVIAPGIAGELGILRGHAPLITALGAGSLRVRQHDDTVHEWFVAAGFLEVLDNEVAVLARHIEEAADVNEADARSALEKASSEDHGDVGSGELDPVSVARARVRFASR